MNDCAIGCLIMASGISKRFGSNKLLTLLGEKPLINYVIELAESNFFAERLLVTRIAETADFCEKLIPTVRHDYETKAEAVRQGVESLISKNNYLDGIIFLQADQPFLSENTIKNMCLCFYKDKGKIIRLSYNDEAASPVIFPKSVFSELMNIKDGKGGAYVIKMHPELVRCINTENKYEIFDVDTMEDLKEAEEYLKSGK